MTPGSAVFLDTNILIYATFPGTPFYAAARSRLGGLETEGARFWTSRQVLREFLATSTRLGAIIPVPSIETVSQAVRLFEAEFEIADENANVTAFLLQLLNSTAVHGRQVHDANIAATMLAYKIPLLLTHNTADFKRYVPQISVLPLMLG